MPKILELHAQSAKNIDVAEMITELFRINRILFFTEAKQYTQEQQQKVELLQQSIGEVSLTGQQPTLGLRRSTGDTISGKKLEAIEYGFHTNTHLDSTYEVLGLEKRAAKNDSREFVVFKRSNTPYEGAEEGSLWLLNIMDLRAQKTQITKDNHVIELPRNV